MDSEQPYPEIRCLSCRVMAHFVPRDHVFPCFVDQKVWVPQCGATWEQYYASPQAPGGSRGQ